MVCLGEWVDSEYDTWSPQSNIAWDECLGEFAYLNQIWHDENYVYAATTDGLNIIDMVLELAYAHITYDGGFNSVWADDDKVYLATMTNGVKYVEKTCISGSTDTPYELVTCLQNYLSEPDILSNKVRYLHGNNGHMVFSTASGINYRGSDVYYQRAEGFTKLSRKVFITPSGKIFYTTWDGTIWKVNIKNANNQDWNNPDKTYEITKDVLDIFVAERISLATIFVATISGVYVIDESTDESDIYYTGVSGLAGTSDVFTAIWADSDADRTNGKMYALSWGTGIALSILDLAVGELYDYYTQTFGGRAEEVLTDTDTRDLSVDTL